jgi:hypothetical protein
MAARLGHDRLASVPCGNASEWTRAKRSTTLDSWPALGGRRRDRSSTFTTMAITL